MKRGGRPGHEKRGGQWRRCGQETPPKLRREGEGAGGHVEGACSDGGAVGSRPPPWACRRGRRTHRWAMGPDAVNVQMQKAVVGQGHGRLGEGLGHVFNCVEKVEVHDLLGIFGRSLSG